MTFTEIVADVASRVNLTSTTALTRIGLNVNRRYRRVTTSIGLLVFRRTALTWAVVTGTRLQTITGIERVISVVNASVTNGRPLPEVSYDEMLERIPTTGDPTCWAVKRADASSVTLYFDSSFGTATNLNIEGEEVASTLSGAQVPAFNESYHDILIYGALADEYRKMEKIPLARDADVEYERLLSDLRLHVSVSAFKDVQQGKYNLPQSTTPFFSGGGGSSSTATAAFVSYTVYNVKDPLYGAAGDGTHDDTAAIRAAIVAATITGGIVYFPDGIYKISGTLAPVQGTGRPIFLQGAGSGQFLNTIFSGISGSRLVWAGAAGGTMVSVVSANGGGIDNLTLDCGASSAANTALVLDSSTGYRVSYVNAFRAASWAYNLQATTAGVYQCEFDAVTSDGTCNGGMVHQSTLLNADVALCNFNRLDLNYSGALGGLDLKASDNNLFTGLVTRCSNGATGGPFAIFRAPAGVQFGAGYNVFSHWDGSTVTGAARTVQADSTLPNIAWGYDYANGMPTPTGAHPELLFLNSTSGIIEGNQLALKTTTAFSNAVSPLRVYSDSTTNQMRSQSWHATVAQGFTFSNRVGAGVEATLFSGDGAGNVTALLAYSERSRTTPMGEWITRVFAAGNYTANGAMTWTLTSGDVTSENYMLVGKTLWFNFVYDTTSVAGVVNTTLQVLIPGGFTAAVNAIVPIYLKDNGAVTNGLALTTAGSTIMRIIRNDSANFTAAANTTSVYGQIAINIQ